jgi:hypothetical protein
MKVKENYLRQESNLRKYSVENLDTEVIDHFITTVSMKNV